MKFIKMHPPPPPGKAPLSENDPPNPIKILKIAPNKMAARRLLTGDKGQAREDDFSLVLQLLLHKLIISNSCNDCYYLTESAFY